MYNTVYSDEYGASTAMNHICDWDFQVRPHLEQKGCSIWGTNVDVGDTMLWAEKCASISCYQGEDYSPTVEYHSWYEGVGCCEYDGYLLNDGEYTWSMSGHEIQCCKGKNCGSIHDDKLVFKDI